MSFEAAFAKTIGVEGGYSDNPDDSGGPTMYGVTEAVARENGFTGDMHDLPLSLAQAIAKKKYWDPLNLDLVDKLNAKIAAELFDTGYNMGLEEPAKFLQRGLNVLNEDGVDYADVLVDGNLGPHTVAALNAYLMRRPLSGPLVMLRVLNSLQGARYVELGEQHAKDQAFVFGWFNKRVTI